MADAAQKPQPSMSTALIRFEPENLQEAIKLADKIAESSIIPSTLRGKGPDVLVMMMTGRDLGLSAMQSLQSIQVIEGIPRLSSKLKLALCLQRPAVCKYFRLVESTDKIATYVTLREGNTEPNRLSFTIEQAQQMGLVKPFPSGKPNRWMLDPSTMLRARASGRLADAIYPDILLNLSEEPAEEAEEYEAPLPSKKQPAKATVIESHVVPPSAASPQAAPAKPVERTLTDTQTGEVIPAGPIDPAPAREPGSDDGDEAPAVAAPTAPSPAIAWAPEIARLSKALEACQSKAEAEALMPDLQKVPKDLVAPLRDLYVVVMKKFMQPSEAKK